MNRRSSADGTQRTGRSDALDGARLDMQRGRVRLYMLTRAGFETLEEITQGLERTYPGTRFSAASVSAELRNLCNPRQCAPGQMCRREKRRRKGQESRGVWEYALYPVAPGARVILEAQGQQRLFMAEGRR